MPPPGRATDSPEALQHEPGALAEGDAGVGKQNVLLLPFHYVAGIAILSKQRPGGKRRKVQRLRRHMQPETVAAAGNLLYHPVAQRRVRLFRRHFSRQQQRQRALSRREQAQIVFAKR